MRFETWESHQSIRDLAAFSRSQRMTARKLKLRLKTTTFTHFGVILPGLEHRETRATRPCVLWQCLLSLHQKANSGARHVQHVRCVMLGHLHDLCSLPVAAELVSNGRYATL